MKLSQKMQCGICYDLIDHNDIFGFIKLNCTHWYHSECINPWFRKNISRKCPLCLQSDSSLDSPNLDIQIDTTIIKLTMHGNKIPFQVN